MAAKSVLDIEVNDGDFKVFLELFEKYKDEVNKLPEGWNDIGKSVEASHAGFGDLVAALTAQALLVREIERREKNISDSTHRQADSWKSIASTTRTVAGNMLNMASSILKWTGAFSIGAGLLGYGGLLGLEGLIHGTGDSRQRALGLGTTIGRSRAFTTDFGRFGGDDGFLNNINTLSSDVTQSWRLRSLGVSDAALQSGDSARIGAETLLKLKDFADKNDPQTYGTALHAYGYDNITSVGQLKTLRGTSREELAKQANAYGTDSNALNIADQAARHLQDLSTALDRSKQKIEATFITAIAPLAPKLEELSTVVADTISGFIKSINKQDIANVGKGIEDFAHYIGSPVFRQGVKDFATDLHDIVVAIHNSLELLGIIKTPALSAAQIHKIEKGQHVEAGDRMIYNAEKWVSGLFGGSKEPDRAAKIGALLDLEKQKGLPAGSLVGIWGKESSFGTNTGRSSAGAEGDFQFMPKTAKEFSVDVSSFESSAMGAAKKFAFLLKEYGGDEAKALAGYNWGERGLNKDIKTHGADWLNFAPKETQDYVRKVMAIAAATASHASKSANEGKTGHPTKMASGRATITVKVANNTSGSATVAVNQVAN